MSEKRTTSIQFDGQMLENIAWIQKRFGVNTISAAIRAALQETARVAKADLAKTVPNGTTEH